MKKLISILLALLTIMVLCCGCGGKGKEETKNTDNRFLPYGLEFGMSYNKAKEVCKDFPEIENATQNDGYASKALHPDFGDYEEFFGIDGIELYADAFNDSDVIILDPSYYFSFNESKELYQFCVLSQIYNSEGSAEFLLNEYIDYFEEKLGKEAEIKESENMLAAFWETDTLKIETSIQQGSTSSSLFVSALIHSKQYELSK